MDAVVSHAPPLPLPPPPAPKTVRCTPLCPPYTKKVRLCQDKHDWEVVRAASAALSVAAYHDANADRMGVAAPNLIPVVVSLFSHNDAEIQAHAATTLANLAHGSPSYQGQAGDAGAIEALLNVCRGRAGCELESPFGAAGTDAEQNDSNTDPTSLCRNQEGNDDDNNNLARGVESKEMLAVGRQHGKDTLAEVGGESGEKTECDVTTTSLVGLPKVERHGVAIQGEGCGGNEEPEGGSETMDVDAILAATAALANLLCYSDANSVRLVDAGGIGVLVGLISSYRPHNLVDFDQVRRFIESCYRCCSSSSPSTLTFLVTCASQALN